MLEEFLKELTELSRKYNLVIGGCGCCSSPWIDQMRADTLKGEYVTSSHYDMVAGDLNWSKNVTFHSL